MYRLFFIICVFLWLPSCGFKPLYGGGSSEEAKSLESIKIKIIGDRQGQILRNKLRHSLTPYGQPRHPKYELAVSLNYTDKGLGVAKDATTTRSQIILDVKFYLQDFRSGKTLYSDTIKSVADYNVLKTSYYSNVVSEKAAKEDLLNEVAESIKVSIASYLGYKKLSDEDSPRTV